MSLFETPNEKLQKALQWFNGLKNEEQALLVAKVGEPDSKFTSEETKNLTVIGLEILTVAQSYTKEQIKSKLVQLGMRDVYAALLIDAILSKPALAQLDIKRLLSLNDKEYNNALEAIIVKLYAESGTTDQILSHAGLDAEDVDAVLRLMRDNILFAFVRGDISEENLRANLKAAQFPNVRIDYMLQLLKNNKKTIADNYIFRNTQDVYFMLQKIEKNQSEMLAIMRELITHLKKLTGGDQKQGQPPHYG